MTGALLWLCLTTGLSGQASSARPDLQSSARPVARSLAPAVGAVAAQRVSAPMRMPANRDQFVYHSRRDVAITFGATAAWIVAEVDKVHLAAHMCNWCDRAPNGADALNGLDSWGRRALVWHATGRAIAASNIAGLVLAPAASYGLDWWAASKDGRRSDAVADAIVISESMAIASDVTDVLKYTIGRERPFVHVLAPLSPATTPQSADNNTSFPSGHTTLAFSLVTSSATIAAMRGYSRASWIWWAGVPAATFTAYFRVAADRHYLTDVLAGASVGSAVGLLVPYLGHRRNRDHRIPAVRVMPTTGGKMVAAEWDW